MPLGGVAAPFFLVAFLIPFFLADSEVFFKVPFFFAAEGFPPLLPLFFEADVAFFAEQAFAFEGFLRAAFFNFTVALGPVFPASACLAAFRADAFSLRIVMRSTGLGARRFPRACRLK